MLSPAKSTLFTPAGKFLPYRCSLKNKVLFLSQPWNTLPIHWLGSWRSSAISQNQIQARRAFWKQAKNRQNNVLKFQNVFSNTFGAGYTIIQTATKGKFTYRVGTLKLSGDLTIYNCDESHTLGLPNFSASSPLRALCLFISSSHLIELWLPQWGLSRNYVWENNQTPLTGDPHYYRFQGLLIDVSMELSFSFKK